jgi:lipid-A-disaccharide synthase
MYPEFIQGAARPAALAAQLADCTGNPARARSTQDQLLRLRTLLAQPAAGTAADWLERHLGPEDPVRKI